MSHDGETLYQLLPYIHRLRDAGEGGPLRALLEVIGRNAGLLEDDLDQLYDDLFIETCAPWVVPYIGDLVGSRSLYSVAPGASRPRALVANTIGYRRRKGTAAMLEQLARDVTGFDACVVEYFQRLATTQSLLNVRRDHYQSPNLFRKATMEWTGTPLDAIPHMADVRRIANGTGRYNIPNIGIFLWRLAAQRLAQVPAFPIDTQRFTFSPLGGPTQLFARPESRESIADRATWRHLPLPLSLRLLATGDRLAHFYGKDRNGKDPNGEDRSFWVEGVALEPAAGEARLLICSLADREDLPGTWENTPAPPDSAEVDPVLGRIAFGTAPTRPPLITCHTGAAADFGGGEYERAATFVENSPVRQIVAGSGSAQAVLDALTAARDGTVEIDGNGRYGGALSGATVTADAGCTLELRAENGCRPVLDLAADLVVTGGADATVVINGLVIAGGALRVPAGTGLKCLRLVHCTLVPGRSLRSDGAAQHPDLPSLVVESEDLTVEIDHCITGGMRVAAGASVQIADSLVDATDPAAVAFAGASAPAPAVLPPPGGTLRVTNSTVVGKVHTVLLELAQNSIFLAHRLDAGDPWSAPVFAVRRQRGCIRFCWLPLEARTPRRYRCQPEWEITRRTAAVAQDRHRRGLPFPAAERQALRDRVAAWLAPRFVSLRYGDAGYGQLAANAPAAIRTGADDESEMGALHDRFVPQREANLRARLPEFLRLGLEAGLFFET